jgi:hypothetical protein
VLRQTVIAMIGGASLAEHESPGEASVHVLSGRVRLSTGQHSWDGRHGDLLTVPRVRATASQIAAAASGSSTRTASPTASSRSSPGGDVHTSNQGFRRVGS